MLLLLLPVLLPAVGSSLSCDCRPQNPNPDGILFSSEAERLARTWSTCVHAQTIGNGSSQSLLLLLRRPPFSVRQLKVETWPHFSSWSVAAGQMRSVGNFWLTELPDLRLPPRGQSNFFRVFVEFVSIGSKPSTVLSLMPPACSVGNLRTSSCDDEGGGGGGGGGDSDVKRVLAADYKLAVDCGCCLTQLRGRRRTSAATVARRVAERPPASVDNFEASLPTSSSSLLLLLLLSALFIPICAAAAVAAAVMLRSCGGGGWMLLMPPKPPDAGSV